VLNLSVCFFYSNSEGWSPTGSTRHVDRQLAYCTCPGWLWEWRIWWNDDLARPYQSVNQSFIQQILYVVNVQSQSPCNLDTDSIVKETVNGPQTQWYMNRRGRIFAYPIPANVTFKKQFPSRCDIRDPGESRSVSILRDVARNWS
jgi:hypothetical protein